MDSQIGTHDVDINFVEGWIGGGGGGEWDEV